MKNLFDPEAYAEINARLDKLTADTPRVWGKMDVAQMLAHCAVGLDFPMSKRKEKRSFMSYILGPIFKKSLFSDKPYKQGLPTGPHFLITDPRLFEEEMKNVKDNLKRFHELGRTGVNPNPHPLFGAMTPDEWGISQYKHFDHHLKQFAN